MVLVVAEAVVVVVEAVEEGVEIGWRVVAVVVVGEVVVVILWIVNVVLMNISMKS